MKNNFAHNSDITDAYFLSYGDLLYSVDEKWASCGMDNVKFFSDIKEILSVYQEFKYLKENVIKLHQLLIKDGQLHSTILDFDFDMYLQKLKMSLL
jgi:hypothetical protein